MYVKMIKSYDEFSGEMDIIVTDGKFDILCYYWPIYSSKLKVGDQISKISTCGADNIMTELNEEPDVKKTDESYYSYDLIGKIFNIEESLISIGELIIKLDGYLPGDIQLGDIVKLSIDRMDAYV